MKTISCKNNFDQIVKIPKNKFFFRPAVYGVIVKNNKVVMLTNKGNNKLWFPGGGVEIGEKMETALKREVLEETGLKIEIKKFLLFKENFFYDQPSDGAFHGFLFFFLCKIKGKNKFNQTDLEDDVFNPQWIEIKKIKQENISDLSKDLFNLLQNLK